MTKETITMKNQTVGYDDDDDSDDDYDYDDHKDDD